jgi:hypothetical protein
MLFFLRIKAVIEGANDLTWAFSKKLLKPGIVLFSSHEDII